MIDPRPHSTQAGELANLAFTELDGAVIGVEKVHQAIADRAFIFAGPLRKPVKSVHDMISKIVYTGIGSGLQLAGHATSRATDVAELRDVTDSRQGAFLVAVVQGLRGDALQTEGSRLATLMSIRVDGRAIEYEPDAVARAFPAATGNLVVFIHGLMENENAWEYGKRPTYGARLAMELDCTPVFIRYNTGLPIAENAEALSATLEELVAAWPVPVEQITLVGHSMGGLLARAAAAGTDDFATWRTRLTEIVCLGSPHLGAPLERLANFGASTLQRLPETAPFGRLLHRRSVGIRDLRTAGPELRLRGVRQFFVVATIGKSPYNPVGFLVGDGLVRARSARGDSLRNGTIDEGIEFVHLRGLHHLALLNNEAVYEQLRLRLSGNHHAAVDE